jgi:hypothetical protein
MGIQVIGNGGTIAEVGASFRELFVGARPLSYGAFGHYKFSTRTGSMAAGLAAAAAILQYRWADATRLAILTRLYADGMFASTAFAVGQILFEMMVARAYTAQAASGTNIAFTGNNQKQRTSMGTSLLNASGLVQISATAALTAGTHTLDAVAHGQINSHSSAGTGGATPIIGNQFLPKNEFFDPGVGDGDHPLVFAQNEGFIVRATVPATGVWVLGLTARWAEVASY